MNSLLRNGIQQMSTVVDNRLPTETIFLFGIQIIISASVLNPLFQFLLYFLDWTGLKICKSRIATYCMSLCKSKIAMWILNSIIYFLDKNLSWIKFLWLCKFLLVNTQKMSIVLYSVIIWWISYSGFLLPWSKFVLVDDCSQFTT